MAAPGPVREALKLHNSDVWKNLAVLVGIPYVKRKLDEDYDVHVAPQASLIAAGGSTGGPRYQPGDDLPPNPTVRQRLAVYYKWFLRNVYPSVNAAYYFSILAFNLAYLFDGTKYSSPFLWLIGTRIRRLGAADHRAIAAILDGAPAQNRSGGGGSANGSSSRIAGHSRSRPGSGLLGLLSPLNFYPQLLSSLRYFLPASIFALKFLEWWHQSDFSRQLARKATEIIDLPAPVVSGIAPSAEERRKAKQEQDENNAAKKTSPKTAPAGNSNNGGDMTTSNRDLKSALKSPKQSKRFQPPISSTSYLPIFTVSLPPAGWERETETEEGGEDGDGDGGGGGGTAARSESSDGMCPICLDPLANPTACQTGYVFCYVCVFHWLNGEHQRQILFMNGEDASAPWDEDDENENSDDQVKSQGGHGQSRQGKWESGKGRCPVTGRRVLGGTDGLRRVLV